MPIDQDHETQWPVYCRSFETKDDTIVQTVLAAVLSPGDAVIVPEVHAVGRTSYGSWAVALVGSYTIVNDNGSLVLRVASEKNDTFEFGGLILGVVIVGDELHLQATGIARTTVLWDVYWRAMDCPGVAGLTANRAKAQE